MKIKLICAALALLTLICNGCKNAGKPEQTSKKETEAVTTSKTEEVKEMKITGDFPGGNIKIIGQGETRVTLEVDLRDSSSDWFYWCFKVENAGGKTVTFSFKNTNRVGYYGPAVSHDGLEWEWQYKSTGHQGNRFTYKFAEDEDEVYFAHDILYRPEHFTAFANERNLEIKTLCISEKGREVPYLDIGTGNEVILLTARHHACESTGSYVLEGVLDTLIKDEAFKEYRIICVPFVDYDGVVDGDQGKNRVPYDHNRDYDPSKPAIYKTVEKIREMPLTLNIKYAFDFHSPWHMGGENDNVFIPIKTHESVSKITEFSKLFEAQNSKSSFYHYSKNNIMPDVSWNTANAPTFAVFMTNSGAEMSFSLETPYFNAGGSAFTPDKAFMTGKAFANALKEYDKK